MSRYMQNVGSYSYQFRRNKLLFMCHVCVFLRTKIKHKNNYKLVALVKKTMIC